MQIEGPDGDSVRCAYVERMVLTTSDPTQKRWITETMCSVPSRIAAAVLRGVAAWNGVGAIQLCYVPLLVLRAEPGGSNAPDRLIAVKPDIQIGMTVGAGHFHQLEAPEQVNPMIERFIEMVARTSA